MMKIHYNMLRSRKEYMIVWNVNGSLILGSEILNIIFAYTPQVRLNESSKLQFWEDQDKRCKTYLL